MRPLRGDGTRGSNGTSRAMSGTLDDGRYRSSSCRSARHRRHWRISDHRQCCGPNFGDPATPACAKYSPCLQGLQEVQPLVANCNDKGFGIGRARGCDHRITHCA